MAQQVLGGDGAMEGGMIWLATIATILVLSAALVGIGTALRRRRNRR